MSTRDGARVGRAPRPGIHSFGSAAGTTMSGGAEFTVDRWALLASSDARLSITELVQSREDLLLSAPPVGALRELLVVENELLTTRVLWGPLDDVTWMHRLHVPERQLSIVRLATESPSAPVRAAACMVLWFAPERTHRAAGSRSAAHFLEWHSRVLDAALARPIDGDHDDILWVTTTSTFGRACEMAMRSNQQLNLAGVAADFFRATVPARGRWSLEIAEELSQLRASFLAVSGDVELISNGLRSEAARHRAANNHGLERRCLACDERLRARAALAQRDMPLREIAASHEAEAALFKMPPVRAEHLRRALEVWRLIPGSEVELRRLEREIDVANRATPGMLCEFEFPMEIPMHELDEFVAPFRELPLLEALSRIASGLFVVSAEDARQQVAQMHAQMPLAAMVEREILKADGTTFRSSPGDDVLLLEATSFRLAASTPFLRAALDAIRARNVSLEDFTRVAMAPGSLVEANELAFLNSAFSAWLRGDYIAFVSVLVPRLERLLRRLAEASGLSTISVQDDGERRLLLSTVLEHLEALAGLSQRTRDALFTMRFFLDSRGGGAVRHELAHGRLDEIGRATADQVLVLFLHAALMRVRTPPSSEGR